MTPPYQTNFEVKRNQKLGEDVVLDYNVTNTWTLSNSFFWDERVKQDNLGEKIKMLKGNLEGNTEHEGVWRQPCEAIWYDPRSIDGVNNSVIDVIYG